MKRTFIAQPTVDALVSGAPALGLLAVPVTERHGEVDEVLLYQNGGVVGSVMKTGRTGLAVWRGEQHPVAKVGGAAEALRCAFSEAPLGPSKARRTQTTPKRPDAAQRLPTKKSPRKAV